MPVELSELLRSTAVSPHQPLDAPGLVRRARRRQVARRATAGAAGLAAAVVVALALPGALRPVQQVDLAPGTGGATAAPDPAPDASAAEPSPPAAEGTPDTAAGQPALPEGALVATDDGLEQVRDGGVHPLFPGPVVAAAPLADGRVVLQPMDGDAPGDIVVLAAGDAGQRPHPQILVPAAPDGGPTLHGVVVVDGRPTLAYTRRVGTGEDQVERLHLRSVDADDERAVAVTGAMESGLGAVAVADGQLVLATCHLQCALVGPVALPPPGEQIADPVAVDVPPRDIRAMALADGLLHAVVVDLQPEDPDARAPVLVTYDLGAASVVAETPLPLEGWDWREAWLALTGDGTAIVALREGRPDGGAGWSEAVVVDLQDRQAQPERLGLRGGVALPR